VSAQTFWQGEHVDARRVLVVVGDSGRFHRYWAKSLVGTERAAVEVTPVGRRPFYLDDEDGHAWHKITVGHGSPHAGHRSLDVARIIRELP
jgi:hypothetical protein